MTRFQFSIVTFLTAAVLATGSAVSAMAQTHTLKLSTFSPPTAASSLLFKEYAEQLKARSGGRLNLEIFYSASMGPMPRQYDLARTGVADIAWMQHGATPGRFPLTEFAHLPFTLPDSEVGARVMMDLLPEFLTDEHKGVKVLQLAVVQSSEIYTTTTPVREIAQLKGMRLRAGTVSVAEMLKELGASPIGVPPNMMAESLQKGTLDGIVTSSTGIFSFKLGNLLKYRTVAFDAVLTFGLVMNPQSYDRLPGDLKALIDEIGSKDGAVDAARKVWNVEKQFEKYVVDSGIERVTLSPAAKGAVLRVAEKLTERRIAELEAKGLPGRALADRMTALRKQHGG